MAAETTPLSLNEPFTEEQLRGMLNSAPENARCGCGNITRFIGHDDHGFGGPDECDGSCERDGKEYCECETVLTQPFTVMRDADGNALEYDYQAWTGGGFDGEIGEYTRVDCAECGAEVYRAPDLTTDFLLNHAASAGNEEEFDAITEGQRRIQDIADQHDAAEGA